MNDDGTYNMEAMKKAMTPSLYQVASTTCADFRKKSSLLIQSRYATDNIYLKNLLFGKRDTIFVR